MKSFYNIYLLLLLTSFYQCDNVMKSDKKVLQLNKTVNSKKNKITQPWDSLNRRNTKAFLTEYGKQNKETHVIIKTDFGNIKIRLYNDTPIHRANFIFLAKIEYFNTTVFYRIAKNFVLQGGNSDEMYTMKQRRKYGNYLMKPEFRKNRKHKYGALAAARQWKKNPNKLSSPFEFYIVQKKSGAHHLDGEHTVFGEVISGFSAMEKMSKVKVGVDEWPVDDVKMKVVVLD